ncbi:hypothetical protein OT109_02950 [Phycisphaeraceae bacterium D3-23]
MKMATGFTTAALVLAGTTAAHYAPYWFHAQARDTMLDEYGLTRDYCYCPSNDAWNDDALWDWDASNTVWGYANFTGDERLSHQNSGSGVWGTQPDAGEATMHQTLDDITFYDVVWMDLSRSDPTHVFGPGGNHVNGTADPGTNTINGKGGGGNVSYIDGHTEWHPENEMEMRWQDNLGYRVWW